MRAHGGHCTLSPHPLTYLPALRLSYPCPPEVHVPLSLSLSLPSDVHGPCALIHPHLTQHAHAPQVPHVITPLAACTLPWPAHSNAITCPHSPPPHSMCVCVSMPLGHANTVHLICGDFNLSKHHFFLQLLPIFSIVCCRYMVYLQHISSTDHKEHDL